MIAKVVGEKDFKELESMIRMVPLKGLDESGNKIFVYKDARISLRRDVNPNEVNPTTFYMLRKSLETQREMRHDLMRLGYDPLHLEGALMVLNNKGEVWTLIPPVIEVTQRYVRYAPQDGEVAYMPPFRVMIPIINDGIHRVSIAREEGSTFTALWISGVDERYQYQFYAHPNDWPLVKVLDELPMIKGEKKMYRLPDCYKVYRDFDVIGCGKPRGVRGEGSG